MYITGGVGSSPQGEAFTVDYDLPNRTAYTETCAAIALIFFGQAMLAFENDSKYADVMERVLYNGVLSGISNHGKAFFYENPLEIRLASQFEGRHGSRRLPITQRLGIKLSLFASCSPYAISSPLPSVKEKHTLTPSVSPTICKSPQANHSPFRSSSRVKQSRCKKCV